MQNAPRSPTPKISTCLARAVEPVNCLLDWFYESQFNPFYRSGTLAVGFIFILLATGFYLLFFYSVSAPYESMQRIEAQIWLGRWIRALHRYAADGALIAIVFHVTHLLVQGKTWGPRLLAWMSGVVMLGALLLSAWTGYVMVWDRHGQFLAESGARMLQILPFLRSEIAQAFDGSTPVASSFFFMNLFLHVAIPLGMFIGLWIHTAKMARTVWFPVKPVFYGSLAALTALAVIIPVPLLPKADLLFIPGTIQTDWFYGFWLPFLYRGSAVSSLAFWVLLVLVGITVPWWWRPPKSERRSPSYVDKNLCRGCMQCSKDCPYEAITMLPRKKGKRKFYSSVNPSSCVSCGVCAASCDDNAIGPPGRKGVDQLSRVREFLKSSRNNSSRRAVLIACTNNFRSCSVCENFAAGQDGVEFYPVECGATVHTDVIEEILNKYTGVFIWGCPERNCTNRDGLTLIRGRMFNKRIPFLDRNIDKGRVGIVSYSSCEKKRVFGEFYAFLEGLDEPEAKKPNPAPRRLSPLGVIKKLSATVCILCGIAYLSAYPMGLSEEKGILRITARLPGLFKLNCRKPTAEENAGIPAHMRKPQICDEITARYRLQAVLNGEEILSETYHGSKSGHPVYISKDIRLPPGSYPGLISLTSVNDQLAGRLNASYRGKFEIQRAGINLITLKPETLQ